MIAMLVLGAVPDAMAERVQGVKWYLSTFYGYYPDLKGAADRSVEGYCVGATYDCGQFVDSEEYGKSGFASWFWARNFTYTTTNSGGVYYPMALGGFASWDCPEGFSANSYTGVCSRPDAPEIDCECKLKDKQPTPRVGNPVYPASGTKEQVEVDYAGTGANTLRFVRTYRSDRNGWAHNYQFAVVDFAAPFTERPPWFPCYVGLGTTRGKIACYAYVGPRTGFANDVTLFRGNNRPLSFGTATSLAPAANVDDRLSRIVDASGASTGWQVTNAQNESTEIYSLRGRLEQIISRNGQRQSFFYSDASTPPTIAAKPELLIRVEDQFQRQLNFTYDSDHRMVSMTDPAGGVTTYAYDEDSSVVLPNKPLNNNLTSVTYPDGGKRIYWYNEQDKTANRNQPGLLTGISDENGVRFATFKYGVSKEAISTEHAGGVEKYVLTYPSQNVQTSVTDPLGATRSYSFQTKNGVLKNTAQSQPAGAGSPSKSIALTYDANGNLASQTDFNGVLTTYTYDLTRNLETKRIEASGTPQARTISTEWHPRFQLPYRIAEPKLITIFDYDTKGNLIHKMLLSTSDASGALGFGAATNGRSRDFSYVYNEIGQLLVSVVPGAAAGVATNYHYDAQGNLATIVNAVGHVTTLSHYDPHGRVGRIVDANGLRTELRYSPRGWLLSKNVGGEVTSYRYDGAGQLTQVTLPDASTIHYIYDPAHRLIMQADSLGNRIVYTLDAMGNRVGEEVRDPGGALSRTGSRVFDALNRLQQITGAVQ